MATLPSPLRLNARITLFLCLLLTSVYVSVQKPHELLPEECQAEYAKDRDIHLTNEPFNFIIFIGLCSLVAFLFVKRYYSRQKEDNLDDVARQKEDKLDDAASQKEDKLDDVATSLGLAFATIMLEVSPFRLSSSSRTFQARNVSQALQSAATDELTKVLGEEEASKVAEKLAAAFKKHFNKVIKVQNILQSPQAPPSAGHFTGPKPKAHMNEGFAVKKTDERSLLVSGQVRRPSVLDDGEIVSHAGRELVVERTGAGPEWDVRMPSEYAHYSVASSPDRTTPDASDPPEEVTPPSGLERDSCRPSFGPVRELRGLGDRTLRPCTGASGAPFIGDWKPVFAEDTRRSQSEPGSGLEEIERSLQASENQVMALSVVEEKHEGILQGREGKEGQEEDARFVEESAAIVPMINGGMGMMMMDACRQPMLHDSWLRAAFEHMTFLGRQNLKLEVIRMRETQKQHAEMVEVKKLKVAEAVKANSIGEEKVAVAEKANIISEENLKMKRAELAEERMVTTVLNVLLLGQALTLFTTLGFMVWFHHENLTKKCGPARKVTSNILWIIPLENPFPNLMCYVSGYTGFMVGAIVMLGVLRYFGKALLRSTTTLGLAVVLEALAGVCAAWAVYMAGGNWLAWISCWAALLLVFGHAVRYPASIFQFFRGYHPEEVQPKLAGKSRWKAELSEGVCVFFFVILVPVLFASIAFWQPVSNLLNMYSWRVSGTVGN